MAKLICLNNPDTKRSRPDVVLGYKLEVFVGTKKLVGYMTRPYNEEHTVVLYGKTEQKATFHGMYRASDGTLHCRAVV